MRTLVPLLLMHNTTAISKCHGASSKLPAAQCEAWQDLFDSTGGHSWTVCAGGRLDPCGACEFCDSAGTNIVAIRLQYNNLRGTLPASIANFDALKAFDAGAGRGITNHLHGTIPSSIVGRWKQLALFNVEGNAFSGPLPAYDWQRMNSTDPGLGCNLLDAYDGGSNAFSCPWPPGVVGNCMKYGERGGALITAADCKP